MADKWNTRLQRNCTALNKLLEEVRKEYPDASLYLDGTYNLHLMSSSSHDENDDAHPENILYSAKLKAGGGDW